MDDQEQAPESAEMDSIDETHDAEVARGFAPPPKVYHHGAVGRALRAVDQKPLVTEACTALIARVAAEKREDVRGEHRNIGMDQAGSVSASRLHTAMPIEATAFGQLCARLGYGGAAYLAQQCAPVLRSHNVNTQASYIDALEQEAFAKATPEEPHEPAQVVLRTRLRAPDAPRSIFAVVSPTYGAFDADKVAEALASAVPEEARGSVSYDGRRSRFEVWFGTTREPKHLAVGEVFRAGVVIKTSDDAGGSIRGQSVAWSSACTNLNLITMRAEDAFAIRHVGSIFELARKFAGGFKKALGSLDVFVRAWDYATEDDVRGQAVSDGPLPENNEELMRGIFRGLVVGSAAPIKVPGRRQADTLLDDLMDCWRRDESSARAVHATSRASVVNAFTRFAHEHMDELNPWKQDELVAAASALLWGRRGVPGEATAMAPRPLAFVEANAGD